MVCSEISVKSTDTPVSLYVFGLAGLAGRRPRPIMGANWVDAAMKPLDRGNPHRRTRRVILLLALCGVLAAPAAMAERPKGVLRYPDPSTVGLVF